MNMMPEFIAEAMTEDYNSAKNIAFTYPAEDKRLVMETNRPVIDRRGLK